jgi:hypothetical protein
VRDAACGLPRYFGELSSHSRQNAHAGDLRHHVHIRVLLADAFDHLLIKD